MIEWGIALAVGVGLGMFYFGGLWLTVRRISNARQPALLTLGSLIARTLGCLLGFYLVMDGHWERLVVCLLGFLFARFILLRRYRPKVAQMS